ncbi:hypothetical protein [Streptomyces dysideae]|uniref:Acetyltransferase n=1 Tax=Streptomyces dysideae TaxID=909626 RepID=A0A117RXB1_9ACTN|nr:hypothetical protein [Streptomyces dysideae]KUO14539.1 hypothetical protein AQJ91_46305 [Streptomyces dysideae]
MTTTPATVELRRYGRDDPDTIRQTLTDVYAEVYADRLSDPFFSIERFEERLEGHVSREPWEVVIGWDGTEPVGYAYGSPLPAPAGGPELESAEPGAAHHAPPDG